MNRKPGDWDCPSCQHMNFGFRNTCQRCNASKAGGGSVGGVGGGGGRSMASGVGFSNYGGPIGGGGGMGGGLGGGGGMGSAFRPGDWYCSSPGCGAHNFASRNNCFKCGGMKGVDSDPAGGAQGFTNGGFGGSVGFGAGFGAAAGGRQGWKQGDWMCPSPNCNEHNFANRTECFRCNAPRRD